MPPPPADAAAEGAAPRAAPAPMIQREAASAGTAPLAKRAPSAMTRGEAVELARDPVAWIERIGKLREAGHDAEALTELREFDALVPNARERLPEELRRLLERGSTR